MFIGPGLYRAIRAMMSSNVDGLSLFRRSFIPELSSWKTPVVSPQHMILYERQGLKPKEVELYKPQLLYILHVILGNYLLVCKIQRSIFDQRPVGYDNAGCVLGCMPCQAFQGLGDIQEIFYLWR